MIEKVTARSAIHGWHGMRSCENLFLKKDWADPVYDQCMIFDLYARERLKSRPAFAADRSPYKEQLREYGKDLRKAGAY